MAQIQHKRGLRLLSPRQHNSQLHGWAWRRAGIRLGASIIPQRLEYEHFLITGSPGSGKTVLIRSMLRQIAERGQTAIILDPESEFIQEFYDEKRGDVILNPLDSRCPFWSPWGEFRDNHIDIDCESTARSLIRGYPRTASEEFFRDSARTLLEAILYKVSTVEAALAFIAEPLATIQRNLTGTHAHPLIASGAQGQSAAILGTVTNVIKTFQHLPRRDETERTWSAREWAEKRQGWIFLSSTEDGRAATHLLQGVWLDALVRWLMSAEIGSDQVWIMADELPALGHQPQIEMLVTRGRKRGLSVVMGFQNVSQIRSIYGRDGAITLISSPTTKVILRCDEPETARWGSDLLGAREVIRHDRSVSNGDRSSTNTMERHIEEQIVTASQIQLLTKRNGYLAVAGHDRTTISIPACWLERRQPAFIPRPPRSVEPIVEPDKSIPDTKRPEYKVWVAMIQRCTNDNHKFFKDYGGRGITVCQEWREFKRFFADMGPRPSDEHQIERRDNDGNYEPDNCCWATREQQRANRRDSVQPPFPQLRQLS